MTGLTSVTFRTLSCEEIIAIAKKAKLNGIEWGGDVHLPPGDIALAKFLHKQTKAAGLEVFSYGSYYSINTSENWWKDLDAVLQTASALQAPIVRIWAGSKGSAEVPDEERHVLTKRLQNSCELAEKYNIQLALEYHRNTLTDTAASTLKLLQEANCANLSTYWQPNPDITLAQQLDEIELLSEYISNIHVFAWKKGNIRLSLQEDTQAWQKFISLLGSKRHNYILEFVKDDSKEQFLEDADILNKLVFV